MRMPVCEKDKEENNAAAWRHTWLFAIFCPLHACWLDLLCEVKSTLLMPSVPSQPVAMSNILGILSNRRVQKMFRLSRSCRMPLTFIYKACKHNVGCCVAHVLILQATVHLCRSSAAHTGPLALPCCEQTLLSHQMSGCRTREESHKFLLVGNCSCPPMETRLAPGPL